MDLHVFVRHKLHGIAQAGYRLRVLDKLTTTGRVEASHLSKVGMVLYYIHWTDQYCSSFSASDIPMYLKLDGYFPMVFAWGCDIRFARKNSPEILRASHRTTTIF